MPVPMARRAAEPSIPAVDPEPDMAAGGIKARKGKRDWVRRAVICLVVLAALPFVLTFLYILPFIHPVSTLMLKDLATLQGYDRQWVSLEEVAPALLHSIVMSEDGQFCSHYGVDLRELGAVIDDAMAGEATRGASTITMQTVKNLFLWHRPLGTVRKVIELPMAVYFDLVVPKHRIMEIYINIAELGPNTYGAEAAARRHFGKSAKNLSRREAALLTAALPNPILRNPAKPSAGMRRIATIIERRAQKAGDYVKCLG
jgi:monofunctional biosynthetic peptidoglycan transglycosylase